MNVSNIKKTQIKILLFTLLLVLVNISTTNADSFNVCGVTLEEPWFIVNNSLGEKVLVIDNDGDMFAQGKDHTSNNYNSYETLRIDNMHFNTQTSKYSFLYQAQSSVPVTEGLIVKSPSSQRVAYLNNNKIHLKGKAAVQGEDANCNQDGYYCSGVNKELRDYFCKINGVESGACDYSVTSSFNCLNKNGWYCSGNIKEYRTFTCTGDDCAISTQTNQFNCNVKDGWYCDTSSFIHKNQYLDYYCSFGQCQYTIQTSQDCIGDCIPGRGCVTFYSTWKTVGENSYHGCNQPGKSQCGAAVGCNCNGENWCGFYEPGQTIKYWVNGCTEPHIMIECISQETPMTTC